MGPGERVKRFGQVAERRVEKTDDGIGRAPISSSCFLALEVVGLSGCSQFLECLAETTSHLDSPLAFARPSTEIVPASRSGVM
jgi:hypothetical protein